MSDLIYYVVGLVLIGLPSLIFYRVGLDVGTQRGVKKQMVRQLIARGIIEPTRNV